MASKRKQFEVKENETIEQCLKRMDDEGYRPVKRTEKPVFKETKKGANPEYYRQAIIFEGVLK
ncbi:NETI motif-containing protein [Bacillus taeanensis]|uniref:NETI motif-containing protein n=1 Tax=Bacillus taeanensis TaxID=273032 RepID=A0A366XWT5_9BACI|nr:NETI motif-containing protein [Bacillus taeanensis]RBW70850.1 NETI motif-containing protein [Bacillus taeanensis]